MMTMRDALRDHIEAVTITEQSITPFLAWRMNRNIYELYERHREVSSLGGMLVASAFRIEKLN